MSESAIQIGPEVRLRVVRVHDRQAWLEVEAPDAVRIRGVDQPAAQIDSVNPTTQHALYLKLFVTNGGGW